MTKQEIEQAIKNGESVWYLFAGVYELKTSEHTDKFITRNSDYCYTDENGVDRCAPLDMLYKSKEEAEHYLNHQDITRTETLPFLTWEEFLKEREIRFVDNIGEEWYLYYHYSDEFIYIYLQSKFGYHGEKTRNPQNLGELTEANFYKAYDECVRLFKGES